MKAWPGTALRDAEGAAMAGQGGTVMKEILIALWKDESGATAIEYGLISGLMAALLIGVLTSFSEALGDLFDAINSKLKEATGNIGSAGSGGE